MKPIHEPLGAKLRVDIAAVAGNAKKFSEAELERQKQYLSTRTADSRKSQEQFTKRTTSEWSSACDAIRAEEHRAAEILRQGAAAPSLASLGQIDSAQLRFSPTARWPWLAALGTLADAPVLAPFIGHKGLRLSGEKHHVKDYVESIFSRLLATIPLNSLRVTVFDPQASGLLGGFSDLREAMPPEAFPTACGTSEALRPRLEAVHASMYRTSELLHKTASTNVIDLVANAVTPPILDVLVIDRSTGQVDDRCDQVLDQLITTGAAHGVVAIIIDTEIASPHAQLNDVILNDSRSAQFTVESLSFRGVALEPVSFATQQQLVREARTSNTQVGGPKVPAQRILPASAHASSASGLEVVIGALPDGKDLTVALRSENPPTTNALIAGSVGQGKSNLLLALIYGIAAKYDPDQVEMMLLDLKEGLEFQRFASTADHPGLPHASVIGLDSDRHFALSVLKEVSRRKAERADAFKAAGLNAFDAYRAAGHQMPRLLIVIDEFQVLFDGDDELAHQAVKLLTDIVKTGRASGIHLVLSSQTLSGMQSMVTRLDAIFSQVAVRLALRNTATESQVVLSVGNKAASQLRFPGQVIVNNFAGQDEANNLTGMTAFIDPQFAANLQQQIWDSTPQQRTARVFDGSNPAVLPAPSMLAKDNESKKRPVLLGQLVDVGGSLIWHEFDDDTNQALAVVGPDARIAHQIFASVLYSAERAGCYTDIIVLGDVDADLGLSRLPSLKLTQVPTDDVATWLRSKQEVLYKNSTLVLVPSLSRLTNMRYSPPPVEEGFSFSTNPTALDELIEMTASNGNYRADVVLGAQSVAAVEKTLGYGHDGSNGIIGYAFADAPLNDIRAVAGYSAERPLGSPRFGYFNVGSASELLTAVPFSLPEEAAHVGS